MSNLSDLSLQNFEIRFKDRVYIGSGGFAKVYKAFDHASNRFVALKIADVRPEFKHFTLRREVELVNNLPSHPNIARYDACYRFDMGVAGEIDFAILKFYEDGNLDQFLRSHELEDADKRIIIRGILMGLEFLHHYNYIHRDLKCQNILMQRDDGVWTPKITDFGLSRMGGAEQIEANSSIGISYAYAAPEQILNKPISNKVDLWSAGVIIYRIIRGELPFHMDKNSENSTNDQIELTRKIVTLDLPPGLEATPEPYLSMIRQSLVLDPAQRISSARELLDILDGFMSAPKVHSSDEPILSSGSNGPPPANHDAPTLLVRESSPPGPPGILHESPPGPIIHVIANHLPCEGQTEDRKPVQELEKPVFPRVGPSRTLPPYFGILLAVLLAGVAFALFLLRDSEKEDYQAETEVIEETELRSLSIPDFNQLFHEQQGAVATGDRALLDSLHGQFQTFRDLEPDCRWPLALAVHHAAISEWDQSLEFLKEAREKAQRDKNTGWLSRESKRLAKGPFAGLVKKRPKEWKAHLKGI